MLPGPAQDPALPPRTTIRWPRRITDLTADPGSLVEALDDLGTGGVFAAGHARLTALAAELRMLRGQRGPAAG